MSSDDFRLIPGYRVTRNTTLFPEPFTPLEWQDWGLCQQNDPEWWFPEKGASKWRIRAAKRICRVDCPVQAECLEYALANGEQWGIWGGLSRRERDRVREQRRGDAA